MSHVELEVTAADSRSPESARLIQMLSQEIARRYDFISDGSGDFSPEDTTVPGSEFLIGRVSRIAVACGAFRPLESEVAEIKRMYVLPRYRGRGYGKRMLEELERSALSAGYHVARLETGARQPEAIALYEHCGFQRIARYGIYLDNAYSVCFEKQLGGRVIE